MHTIRQMIALCLAAVCAVSLAAGKEGNFAELAPFTAQGSKAMVLGTLLGNPLMPALLVASLQQNMAANYGAVRSDKPFFWAFVPHARDVSAVAVLPCAEGIARFTLHRPGATRLSGTTVQLPPSDGHPLGQVVAFDAADGYAAFASTAALAQHALEQTAAARRAARTRAGQPLAHIRLGAASFASLADSAKAFGTNRVDTTRLIANVEATVSLDASGLALAAEVEPKEGVAPETLKEQLEKTLGASLTMLGEADGVRPVCTFSATPTRVRARLSLPAEEMKKAGAAFNAAVVKSLAPPKEKAGKKR